MKLIGALALGSLGKGKEAKRQSVRAGCSLISFASSMVPEPHFWLSTTHH